MSTAPETALPLSVARVVLRAKKALPFFGRHPWVRDSAVHRVEPLTMAGEHLFDPDGQVVDLVTDKCKFIARGFYNSKSRIRVRLYTWSQDEALDEAFFRRRIETALALRRQIGYEPAVNGESSLESPCSSVGNALRGIPNPAEATSSGEVTSQTRNATEGDANSRNATEGVPYSATRLIFSESDGLSGLVVDRYGDYLVVQITSLAIAERLEMIVGILQELLAPRAIVLRTEKSMAQIEGVEFTEGKTWGELPEGTLEIREHGLSYQIDLHEGQKTGFYLDQRENRRAVAGYLAGRRVLDMFCYTGGFAMCAAALGGAKEVLGIDSSKKAIAQARANVERNNLQNVGFEIGDGFQSLDALIERGEKFDAVILDPPKFARNRSGLNQALMAYHRLNRTAVELLSPGGILVTCSCSGSVSREDFSLMLSVVAQKSGRDIQVLEQRGAAADHPVSSTCLETEYLKCFVCRVV